MPYPVYLYDAVRTPRGKARPDGGLANLAPQELVRQQAAALAARCGDIAATPEALILGCVTQVGAQGGHIALVSKLHAGLPGRTAAHSVNNYCASGLSAIGQAVAKVASGEATHILAGGVESMSASRFLSDGAGFYTNDELPPHARFVPPVLAADRLANSEGIARAELDTVALASQVKAAATENDDTLQASRIATGALTGEECIRPQTSTESLAAAPAAFGELQAQYARALEGASFEPLHSIAHAPPICDGAGLALIGGEGLGIAPRARVVAFAESGGDPAASLTAGFAAMDKVLTRARLTLGDMDRIEFMEAFAVTIAKFLRDRDADPARVNVSGGHLAKGHPMGASGAILTSTLLDALDACDGRYGLVVLTGAMGVGAATVVERVV
ncbi:beta-ketoacyl synthase N-terminal-like domain-containing protein [Sphingopyxis sp. JAI128]|uniref:thiolase family protein n=1 Tax=Sphingopyxis sp. JAI128 TaxID=2723066 RepID=UPI00180F2D68|nr:beta-ketoacyl synthase N-terminal-like domain-containing protein [Sphingopyxis sp. JAI128]MBB6425271.1 acetyl-CoA C-acetyltransferase/acetyl-CoA acyltransferase [Sphingopyxis sp. JAI128]